MGLGILLSLCAVFVGITSYRLWSTKGHKLVATAQEQQAQKKQPAAESTPKPSLPGMTDGGGFLSEKPPSGDASRRAEIKSPAVKTGASISASPKGSIIVTSAEEPMPSSRATRPRGEPAVKPSSRAPIPHSDLPASSEMPAAPGSAFGATTLAEPIPATKPRAAAGSAWSQSGSAFGDTSTAAPSASTSDTASNPYAAEASNPYVTSGMPSSSNPYATSPRTTGATGTTAATGSPYATGDATTAAPSTAAAGSAFPSATISSPYAASESGSSYGGASTSHAATTSAFSNPYAADPAATTAATSAAPAAPADTASTPISPYDTQPSGTTTGESTRVTVDLGPAPTRGSGAATTGDAAPESPSRSESRTTRPSYTSSEPSTFPATSEPAASAEPVPGYTSTPAREESRTSPGYDSGSRFGTTTSSPAATSDAGWSTPGAKTRMQVEVVTEEPAASKLVETTPAAEDAAPLERYTIPGRGDEPTSPAPRVSRTSEVEDTAAIPETERYRIEPHDNYWVISQKLYGTGDYFKALAKHNEQRTGRGDLLRVGKTISCPAIETLRQNYPDFCPRTDTRDTAAGAAPSIVALPRGGKLYRVQDGDTLYSIAATELGKGSRWVEIYELNKPRLGAQIDRLRAGAELALPESTARDAVTEITSQPRIRFQR